MLIFASDEKMGVRYKREMKLVFVNSWRGGQMENVPYQDLPMRDALRSWCEGTWSMGTTFTTFDLRHVV
jgi:hypothetical protein